MKQKPTTPQKVNAKTLLRLLRQADKNVTLNKVTRLYIQRETLKENRRKLNEKLKTVSSELKEATELPALEQFTFKF